ncbi:dsRBD fold-containing protein [Streptomyces sp. HPF1205]|uniref:dsRBD fold-containing protein n=1 Tax=Streptomyces sp. HPF1205 TaxID=2873262 RepID=UPI001CED4D9B|nr:dsRBD fold-containing protein [Streptomyces sp. HPF1205]
MTQQDTGMPARSKTWTLRLDIVEEDMDSTSVDAYLDTGHRTLACHTSAHRNPHDPPAPDIGDEYAAGRALLDLGKQLLRAGTSDAAENAKDVEF